VQADGTRLSFNADPHQPSRHTGADPAQGYVQTGKGYRGEREYTWHWTHGEHAGRRLYFDGGGWLVRITAASGATLTLTRGAKGQLLEVVDPQGRTLRFNRGDRAHLLPPGLQRWQ